MYFFFFASFFFVLLVWIVVDKLSSPVHDCLSMIPQSRCVIVQ